MSDLICFEQEPDEYNMGALKLPPFLAEGVSQSHLTWVMNFHAIFTFSSEK